MVFSVIGGKTRVFSAFVITGKFRVITNSIFYPISESPRGILHHLAFLVAATVLQSVYPFAQRDAFTRQRTDRFPCPRGAGGVVI